LKNARQARQIASLKAEVSRVCRETTLLQKKNRDLQRQITEMADGDDSVSLEQNKEFARKEVESGEFDQ
jgi:hypothetical protein